MLVASEYASMYDFAYDPINSSCEMVEKVGVVYAIVIYCFVRYFNPNLLER